MSEKSDISDTEIEIKYDYNIIDTNNDNIPNSPSSNDGYDVITVPERKRGRPKKLPEKPKRTLFDRSPAQMQNIERARIVHTQKKLERIKQREDEIQSYADAKIRLENLNIQSDVEKKVEELLEQRRLEKMKQKEEERLSKLPVYKNTWIDKKTGKVWNF